MAIKFQYNKTSLNNLGKQLKMRQGALPTLKNKESALRLEVRKAKEYSDKLMEELAASMEKYDYIAELWNEFEPNLISITDVDLHTVKPFNAFQKPAWFADGIQILKEISKLGIESEVYLEKSRILGYQRKKTTQKVNLYEKVQIPGYKEAIRKIKRYMEDEENLSKASSKIVKIRHEEEENEEASIWLKKWQNILLSFTVWIKAVF